MTIFVIRDPAAFDTQVVIPNFFEATKTPVLDTFGAVHARDGNFEGL